MSRKILEVKGLKQSFDLNRGILDKLKIRGRRLVCVERIVHAVNDISFDVIEGETFSLVGESGCGKSTTARTVIRLLEPKAGSITFDGVDITALRQDEMIKCRKEMQMIFQDPFASLNPRKTVFETISEPMLFHKVVRTKSEALKKTMDILSKVGIRAEQANRYPHQFSGGQRQRIGIARALAVEPKFIVADEPVSALDVSIQAQILNILMDLQDEFNFSYLFIAHDLSVVKHISNRLGVMYLGKIVECGDKKHIFGNPKHPYTEALLSAVPKINGGDIEGSKPISGEIPSPINLPDGCYFHERCPKCMPICKEKMPEEVYIEPGHRVLCHLYNSEDKR